MLESAAMVRRRTRQLWAIDNLEGLAQLSPGSVGLAYLDPPFNSKRSYDAILATSRESGRHRGEAFNDDWRWSDETRQTAMRLSEWLPRSSVELVVGLIRTLGETHTTAYLVMMAPRLAEVCRTLREDGSIYVHCDPAASHYLKVLLDHLLGPENFRNEIVWKRTHAHSSSRRYGPVHDSILFYTKGSRYTWNPVFAAYRAEYLDKHFRQQDDHGRFQLITCTAPGDRTGTRAHYEWRGQWPPPGRHWAWKREQMEMFEREGRLAYSSSGVPRLKRYTDDGAGVPVQDIWSDINRLDAHSEERVGFETQKPLALLERIIAASSEPDDIVLDPFCGSGTTAVAAEQLGRQWVAIDSSIMACSIALSRVRQKINLGAVSLEGFPADVATARSLLRSEPLAFGLWGTSMLATLADRKGFNDSVATGWGRLRTQSRTVELLSWVPLRTHVNPIVSATRHGRLSKVGYLLRHARQHSDFGRSLQQRLSLEFHEVGIESLVAKESLQQGVAREVTDLTAATP
jgi:DNA modification methylase